MILNQKGMSLVETLVSLSIVAIISLAIAQMARDSMNALNYSESKFDELELSRQIQMYLGTKPSCERNFTNKLVTNLDPKSFEHVVRGLANVLVGEDPKLFGIKNFSSIVDLTGKKLVAAGDVVGNRSIKVSNVDFIVKPDSWSAFLAARTALVPGSKGVVTTGHLQITVDRVKTEYGGKTFSRSFPVNVLLDATGRVTGCYTEADAAADTVINIIENQLTEIVNNSNITNTIINNTIVNNPPVVAPPPPGPTPVPSVTPVDPCARGSRKSLSLLLYCFFHRSRR